MRPAFVLLLAAGAALAQPFTWGVRAGVPLNDAFNTVSNQNFTFNTNTNRYLIGPTAELHLPFGLGVEVDALYRHFSYTGSGIFQGSSAVTNVSSGNWEFPLLLKYRFPAKIVRPYIDAGVAWNKLSGLTQTVSHLGSTGSLKVEQDNSAGFVLGGGIDLHAVFVHVMPEIRYIRWGSAQITDPTGFIKSSQNEAQFLVGFTF